MGKRKHKKTKLLYRVDTVEDLRGMENAPADFKLTFWLSNDKSYRMLFDFEENDSELTLAKCEIDGKGPLTNTTVKIPERVEGYPVTKIKSFAFRRALNQESLSLPNTIKSIGGNAFSGCKIHDLFIPASVSEIGTPAFQNSEIYSIIVDKDNIFYDSRNNCNSIIDTFNNELIAGSANSTIPDTVTTIRDGAFCMCNAALREIIIPQSVKRIGEHAFAMCLYLEKVSIASSIIGETAFSQCENLKEVSFSDSVTKIGEVAFGNCRSLKEVIIPSSVTMIEEGAFEGCSSLERIVIPDSIEEIGENTFSACENLKEVQIPNSIKKIDAFAFSYCENLEKVTISNSVEKIGASAFFGCNSLKSMVIPEFVEEIEENTFNGCENLKEVQISNSVKRIGVNAFRGCKGLERVVIPDSVTFIGLSAFLGCDEAQIIIKNSSLLKAAFQLSIDELLKRKRNESLGNQKDSELLRLELQRCFRNIYWEFYNEFSNGYEFHTILNGDINKTFFHSIKRKIESAEGRCLFDLTPFVKSIRLFGGSTDNYGEIDLYIDKEISEKYSSRRVLYGKDFDYIITENRDKLKPSYRHNPVLDPSSFVFADLNSNIIEEGVDIFFYPLLEYSTSPHETILNGKYYATIVADRDEEGKLYHEASPYLQATCDILGFLDENRPVFHQMDLYSDVISNYFFVSSYFIDNRGKADCVLFAKIGIDKKAKNNADEVMVFLTEFKTFMDSITQLISFMIQTHEHRQQALEGAIAKVMARNLSHNIGSHVFSHLVGDRVYEKLSDKSVSELDSYISCYEEPKKDERAKNAVNHQLSHFNRYLKNRMDYLSEVTFSVSNTVVTKSVYGEVFKELDNVRILLNHISGITDFKFGFSLMHNGVSLSEEDILVAFPGDVLGCQAFFNIIENIIRNTAKHATKKDQIPVMFNINFIDKKDFPDYFCVEIDNGIKETSIERLVYEQNEIIDQNILDRDFNLRNNGLGIVEMKTSCAYLRQLNMSAVDSKKYSRDRYYSRNDHPDDLSNHYGNLILLKAINKNGALGYRFFMHKPKEFLLVGNFDVADSQKDAVDKEGVRFISEEDFAKAMSDGKSFAHPILFYSDNVSDKTKALLSNDNDSKTLLPIRIVKLNQDETNEMLTIIKESENILFQLKDFAWKKYMRCLGFEDGDIHIGEVISRRFNNSHQIVFENHGKRKDHENNWSKRTVLPELWIDNLSSYTQSKLPSFAQFSKADDCVAKKQLTSYIESIPLQIKLEIFEAYHNKVVVLDERIQRFALESYEGSSENGIQIPSFELFESTNVVIPNIKLDPERFDDTVIHELESFINKEIGDAFLLVHYGILERMYKTEHTITERLEEWAKKTRRVVVTSGRGSHSLQLPDSVCFANLSSVLNAFTENRSKFVINCLINQSRRKK
jgi:hypothetical protein